MCYVDAHAAIVESSWDFRTHPHPQHQPAAAPAMMAPPPPRASAHAVHHTRPIQAPPVGQSDPPSTWAADASRRPLQNTHTPMDDSYLDVLVSSLRHHNYDFPTTPQDAIFALVTTTFDALENVGRSKASLRFALDLALTAPSPLSVDIVNGIIELCELVQQMYSARYSPKWFSTAIKKTRESRTQNCPAQIDSSASDRSVEARQPRHREEPMRERGQTKRVMTALTTDSDTRPDSPGDTDRDKRPPRQVTPRVFHAPDPLSLAPPFPPRIARPWGTRGNDPPHLSPEPRPTLGTPMLPDENSKLTLQSLEIITVTTIAALNQHLASIGLLPRIAATPSGDPTANTYLLPPAPRDAPLISPRTLPVPPRLAAPIPGPVLSSASTMNNAIHHLRDDGLPDSPSSHDQHRFPHDFILKMQAEYRTLDTRRVPRVQHQQFCPHTDRTAATQLLFQSMANALSGMFDVADPSGSVTMRSPTWVSGWHAPLLKLTKASFVPNRDDPQTLHRLVDDLFAQLQERPASGVDGPAAFRTLLTDVADHFDRAPRGAALETLQKFDVPSGTPFSSLLCSFRVVVASTVDKGGPLAPSPDMAMELIRIRSAHNTRR